MVKEKSMDEEFDDQIDWISEEPEPDPKINHKAAVADPRVANEFTTPDGGFVDRPIPRPVFGMDGVFGGANPTHITAEPSSPLLAFEQIRERFVRGGMDSYELLTEVKRLMRAGFIELSPKEVKTVIEAETKLAETLVKLTDTENKLPGLNDTGSKTLVLQVLNQTYNILAGQMEQAREKIDGRSSIEIEMQRTPALNEKTIEAVIIPDEETARIARFRASRGKK